VKLLLGLALMAINKISGIVQNVSFWGRSRRIWSANRHFCQQNSRGFSLRGPSTSWDALYANYYVDDHKGQSTSDVVGSAFRPTLVSNTGAAPQDILCYSEAAAEESGRGTRIFALRSQGSHFCGRLNLARGVEYNVLILRSSVRSSKQTR